MQELTIRLDDPIIEALRVRARQRDSSVEDEVRPALLEARALASLPSRERREAGARRFDELRRPIGGEPGLPEHDSARLIRAYRDAS